MKTEEQYILAQKLNGIIGEGPLNWLGNYNYELKRNQFNIFFHKKTTAEEAIRKLKEMYNYEVNLNKTPSYINSYFRFSATIFI